MTSLRPEAELLGTIKPLDAEITKVRAQMKEAGLFADDRDLLEFPNEGFTE